MGLLGLIVGYTLASGMGSTNLGAPAESGAPTAQNPTPPPPPPTNDTPATADDDMVLGDADAPITLIKFSDFQCPFSAKFYTEALVKIKEEYIDEGKVKLVYRDYPLSFHPNAFPAALAVECAADQSEDVAWALHDAIFKNQSAGQELNPENIKKWAAGVSGLNGSTLQSCIDNKTHEEEINKDMADGQASGIDGTPGFWILGPNGQSKKISGAYPFDTFKAEFDAMLQ